MRLWIDPSIVEIVPGDHQRLQMAMVEVESLLWDSRVEAAHVRLSVQHVYRTMTVITTKSEQAKSSYFVLIVCWSQDVFLFIVSHACIILPLPGR